MAAALGAAIGLEREVHEHPAGMRTHLLVSMGSAAFTVLSIEAFKAPGADPPRVAAQIVTGVGFLGAGAILKEGATIRGLTTAASLWAVAAVGMAAGAGAWVSAVTITIIVILSLWPLRVITERFVGRDQHRLTLRVATADPHSPRRRGRDDRRTGWRHRPSGLDHSSARAWSPTSTCVCPMSRRGPPHRGDRGLEGIELIESRASATDPIRAGDGRPWCVTIGGDAPDPRPHRPRDAR